MAGPANELLGGLVGSPVGEHEGAPVDRLAGGLLGWPASGLERLRVKLGLK